jgi:hypothetical protein
LLQELLRLLMAGAGIPGGELGAGDDFALLLAERSALLAQLA